MLFPAKPVVLGPREAQTAPSGRRGPGLETSLHFEWRGILGGAVFFGFFFVFLWLGVDVKLIYHGGGEIQDFPVFYWGWGFLRETLSYVGGAAEYIAALEMQSLFYSGLGALVLTGHACLLFLCIRVFARAIGVPHPSIAGYVFTLLLLALYSRYAHFASVIAGISLTLALLSMQVPVPGRPPLVRLGVILLATVVLYAIGPGALPLFSVSAALLAWRATRDWRTTAATLVIGATVVWTEGTLCYGLAPGEAFQALLPVPCDAKFTGRPGAAMLIGLYLLAPVLGLAVILWEAFMPVVLRLRQTRSSETKVGAGRARPATRHGKSSKSSDVQHFRATGLSMLGTACLVLALATVFYFSHDRRLKSVLEVDYFCANGMWSRALASARAVPKDPFVVCSAVQAAAHTGQLTRALPTLPQPSDLLLLERAPFAHWKQSGLYLDLGFINLALHHLTEAVEFWGERPLLLERLALANMALGNINTARIYLNALARVPFHGAWARRYLELLDSSDVKDEEVIRLRSLAVKQDVVGHPQLDEQMLLLLEANRTNRMAYEYLMTYYLLAKDLTGFAANLSRTNDFASLEVSPLWNDAAVLFAASQNKKLVPGEGELNPESIRRFDRLVAALREAGNDREAARARLEPEYGNTYFYYHLFH